MHASPRLRQENGPSQPETFATFNIPDASLLSVFSAVQERRQSLLAADAPPLKSASQHQRHVMWCGAALWLLWIHYAVRLSSKQRHTQTLNMTLCSHPAKFLITIFHFGLETPKVTTSETATQMFYFLLCYVCGAMRPGPPTRPTKGELCVGAAYCLEWSCQPTVDRAAWHHHIWVSAAGCGSL